MNTSSVTIHNGEMRCSTLWEPSGQQCFTDVAAAVGGKGEYPTPAALLASAVASCMLSMVAHTGANKGFDTRGITITADYETGANGSIAALSFEVNVPMPTSPLVRRLIEAAVTHCPVGAALAPSVEKKLRWHWAE